MALRFWIVCLGCVILAAMGIGLEIARAISDKNHGASCAISDFAVLG